MKIRSKRNDITITTFSIMLNTIFTTKCVIVTYIFIDKNLQYFHMLCNELFYFYLCRFSFIVVNAETSIMDPVMNLSK